MLWRTTGSTFCGVPLPEALAAVAATTPTAVARTIIVATVTRTRAIPAVQPRQVGGSGEGERDEGGTRTRRVPIRHTHKSIRQEVPSGATLSAFSNVP